MRSFPQISALLSLVSVVSLSALSAGCEETGKDDTGGTVGGDDGATDGGADGATDGTDGADGTDGTDGSGPVDADGDGATSDVDCDDDNVTVFPDAPELCDALDNDCDGEIDEEAVDATTWFADADEDGFGDAEDTVVACAPPAGFVGVSGDCDAGDGDIFPGAPESCDSIDSDCDGDLADPDSIDATTCYPDEDDDTYGNDALPVQACSAPTNHVPRGGDCDDGDERVSPEAEEICNGRDDDCDTLVDDADDSLDLSTRTEFFADADSDTYGDPAVSTAACDAPPNTVPDDTDCDDTDADVNPAAVDVPQDTVDQDCDGADAPYRLVDLVAGDLVITEFMQNPNLSSDANGEWFEVYNGSGGQVELDGLYVYDLGTERFTVTGPLLVEDGEYVVFGVNADLLVNGGVAVDYDFASSYTLGNSDDEIGLADSSALGVVFDVVAWDNGLTFPDGNGASSSLSPSVLDATLNDLGSNWCLTFTATFGLGDKGTPGEANESCSP